MKIKIPIIITLVLCGLYVLLNAPFGKNKFYWFEHGDSVRLSSGIISTIIRENDFPFKLSFGYAVRRDAEPPSKVFIENATLIGTESGFVYELGSSSADVDDTTHSGYVRFVIHKKKGMIYEPYDIKAVCRLVMKDGSETSQEIQFFMDTKYEEHDKIPWWMPL